MDFSSNPILVTLRNLPIFRNSWRKHLAFLALIFLSVFFFKERMAMMDSAGYTFKLIYEGGFNTPHNRFGAMITQLIPYVLIHLKAPLLWVMVGYSMSFILVYYFCFWLCSSVLKQPHAAWLILLIHFVGVRGTFFWPVSELVQGLVYSAGFWALLSRARLNPNWWLVFFTGICFLTCILPHPITHISLVFLLACEFVLHHRYKDRGYWFTFAYSYFKPPASGYKSDLLSKSLEDPIPFMFNFFEHGIIIQIKGLLKGKLCFTVLPILVMILGLVWQRKWFALLFGIGGLLGYLIILVMPFPKGESPLVLENLLLPVVFMSGVMCAEYLPGLWKKKWAVNLGFWGMTGLFLFGVFQESSFARYRLKWPENMYTFSRDIGQRKLIMDIGHFPAKKYGVNWALAPESMLLSALHGPDSTMFIYGGDDYEMLRALPRQNETFLYARFWVQPPIKDMDPHFFKLPATPFYQLNTESTDSLNLPLKLDIKLLSSRRAPGPLKEKEIEVYISNQSAHWLRTGIDKKPKAELKVFYAAMEGELVPKTLRV